MKTATNPERMTPADVAVYFSVSVETVLRWLATGRLEGIDVSSGDGAKRRWRVKLVDVLDFEERRNNRPIARARRRKRKTQNGVTQFF